MPRYRNRPMRLRRTVTGAILPLVRRMGQCYRLVFIHRPIPVEALVADPGQRRNLESEVVRCLRQLQRALGPDFPAGLAVIIQQTLVTDHQLAGCFQIRHQSGSASGALIRLALSLDGRRLSIDEILAALADACVGLADHSGQPGVLVPVGRATLRAAQSSPATALRSDPLMPRPNGTIPHQQAAG